MYSQWQSSESGRRSHISGRRWAAGLLAGALAVGLWYSWARWAAGFAWDALPDAGLVGAALVTVLLLLLVPAVPALIWTAGQRGSTRGLAWLAGLLAYAGIVAAELGLLRL